MKLIRTRGLLVRSVPYRESDLIVTLFTEDEGKVAAIARGARKGSRRMGGALEPFHTLEVALEDRGKDLMTLREASLSGVRSGIMTQLDAVDAAGIALRWTRHVVPPRTKEPAAWGSLHALLDALDAGGEPRVFLATFGLHLLADVGYALDLSACVRCGKPCPKGGAAEIDPARGGLVCRACGGGRTKLDGAMRELALAVQGGEAVTLNGEQAEVILSVVELAMAVHTELEPR